MYKILEKKTLNSLVDQYKIHAPLVSRNSRPGNFVIIRVNDKGERIPLTIVDHDEISITIIVQKLGYSTKLLAELNVNDYIHDVVGPLGVPTRIRDVSRVIAVAGGVGAAPLLPQLRAYHNKLVNIDLVIGARSKEYLILLEEYKEICNNIYICTDDGSLGHKGYVTDFLKDLLLSKEYDLAIAIGPMIMMKSVVELTKLIDLPTDVSLNPIMIDGTGMCGNCRVTIHGKTYFACVDGPDFDSDGINFDELLSRQNYYKDAEHICNLELKKQ